MSSLSIDMIGELVRNRLNLGPEDKERLQSLIVPAIKSLAIKVARRADWQSLRKEIAVTCTSGVITLSDVTILSEVLLDTGELILNSVYCKQVPSYQELTNKLPTDIYWWTLKTPTKIHVRNIGTGALGAVTQNGTLACNTAPSLVDLPDVYDEQLLDEIVILASGKVEQSPAAPLLGGDSPLSVSLKND